MTDESVLKAVCAVVVLGTDENEQPVHLTPYEAAKAIKAYLEASWRPIAEADKTITHLDHFPSVGLTLRHSDRYWVRDDDGRVYEASWSEGNKGGDYWWDWDGESPVDPIELMPHPLSKSKALTDEQAALDAEMFDQMTEEFSQEVDQAWQTFKAAIPAAVVINDNQPGKTAIIEILTDPPTLAVGTKLFAAPVKA